MLQDTKVLFQPIVTHSLLVQVLFDSKLLLVNTSIFFKQPLLA